MADERREPLKRPEVVPVPKGTPVDLTEGGPTETEKFVQDAYKEEDDTPDNKADTAPAFDLEGGLRKLATDFLRLTQAVRHMNHYQQKIPEVEEVCKAILAPDERLARANQSLAEARACAVKIGKLIAVTADWDNSFRWLFTFRGNEGYATLDGFDLRPETPGLATLKEALQSYKVPLSHCDLTPPLKPREGQTGVERRVIWTVPNK